MYNQAQQQPQIVRVTSHQNRDSSRQEQLTIENLKLKQEIERLQSIVQNYQLKEKDQKVQDFEVEQEEQNCALNTVVHQDLLTIDNKQNNSTFIICNQLPSFIKTQIKAEPLQFLDQSSFKDGINYFSLGKSSEGDDKQPMNLVIKNSQNNTSFNLEGISEIRSSLISSNQQLEDQTHNQKECSTERLQDLENALNNIKNQERELKEMLELENYERKQRKKYDMKENLQQKLQDSERSIIQIRELCKELEKEKLQLNSTHGKGQNSKLKEAVTQNSAIKANSIERQSKYPSSNVRSPVNLKVLKENSLLYEDQKSSSQLKRQNQQTINLRGAKSLIRNVSQENYRNDKASTSRQQPDWIQTFQYIAKHNAVASEYNQRSRQLLQSRRLSRQSIKPFQQSQNPTSPSNRLKRAASSKPIFNAKTQTLKNFNMKQILQSSNEFTNANSCKKVKKKVNMDQDRDLSLGSSFCGKSIQNVKFEVDIPNLKNEKQSNSNLFNCGDSNDLSKNEKSLLEEFRRFLQHQQDKKIVTQKENIIQSRVEEKLVSPTDRSKSNTSKKPQQSMKHCLNCVQLLSRGLSTAFCKEHQYARSKMMM